MDRKPFVRWELVQNEEKVKFYTGLPCFDILQNVFEHVSPFGAYKSQNLTTFQEFVMTLIKLKLDTASRSFISLQCLPFYSFKDFFSLDGSVRCTPDPTKQMA